ncbi:hypothetical protein [Kosakonia phage Kc166A]|uniref:Uncharacterized protein n=1 Tax=Kosakonia phage Kc166A TaxID=2801381 RepID=A0AAE7RK64_9CAUD|nr:hypothetical protein [Kosakonia phage Kc166A]
MKFAHKVNNVDGGNQVVTVTVADGKALVKVSLIPTGKAKGLGISQKQVVALVMKHHEETMKAEANV